MNNAKRVNDGNIPLDLIDNKTCYFFNRLHRPEGVVVREKQ